MKNVKMRLFEFYRELSHYGFTEVEKESSFMKEEFSMGSFMIKNSLGQTVTIDAETTCINIRVSVDNVKEHDILYHGYMHEISGMFICVDTLYIMIEDNSMYTVYIGKEIK